jgi:hypothetical protein
MQAAVMENGRINVHRYEKAIESLKCSLGNSDKREDNKKLIRRFISFCMVDSKIGHSRIRLYLFVLK